MKARFLCGRFLAMHGLPVPFRIDTHGAEYWRSRKVGGPHGPENYTVADNSTRVTLDDILSATGEKASFLEVGCNAGRNLNYLYERGCRDLAGIDVNASSIHVSLKTAFPELHRTGRFFVGDAAEVIKSIPNERFDTVFSIAVLEHIPPQSMSLFRDMVRVSKKYIAVVTGENRLYDFQRVFEDLDCTTIAFRLFYGDQHRFSLPRERYNEEKHFFDSKFLRIFIKNERS